MTNTKTKTILTVTIAAVAVSMVAGMAYADFSGVYAPGNWTTSTNGGDGSVNTGGAPASISLTSSNTNTFSNKFVHFEVDIICDTTVDFDWEYDTVDVDGSGFDPASYLVNGAHTQVTVNLSDLFNGIPQTGSESVPVSIGDTFGLGIRAIDDQLGRATFEITNFDALKANDCADIDIKPGSDPNSINNPNKGVVPVGLLGSATYDVSDVDVTTLTFGPGNATPKHDLTDALTLAEHTQDVNLDGFPDLVAHFPTADTGLVPGTTEGCLSWDDSNFSSLEACDTTRVFDAPGGFKPNP